MYSRDMTLLGVVDEIKALVWTRRYWDCGEFSLLVPLTDRHAQLFRTGRIIARKDSDEAGQARYITISRDANGLEQMEIKGLFLTHWLGTRLLLERLLLTAPTHQILQRIVTANLISPTDSRRAIPKLTLAPANLDDETLSCTAEPLENVLDVCSSRAKLAKIGFRIISDLRTGTHSFSVYKGRDCTAAQTVNTPCIFSPDFDNVLSQEYTHSVENVATAVYVKGQESEDEPPLVAEVAQPGLIGLDRVEHLDADEAISRSYMKNGTEYHLSDAEYLELLGARGAQVLDNKSGYNNFTSFLYTHGHLKYKRDYDLGDRVTCINRRWGVRIDVRITEVTESYENGKADLEITFGESLPTLSTAMKWR